MTIGFGMESRRASLVGEIVGWKLYEVHFNKYHVMFWFEGGCCLLNAAWRFRLTSFDGVTTYAYDVEADGGRKVIDVDRILNLKVVGVDFPDDWEMRLTFSNGDNLIIGDQPHHRSCWAFRWSAAPRLPRGVSTVWFSGDDDPDDIGGST